MKFFKNGGNLIILGFVTCAVGMIFLAYKSMQVKFDMAVEGDYYYEELKFDDVLKAKQNANQLEDELSFNHSQEKLVLTIPHELSEHIEKGMIEFYCVSDSQNDTHQSIVKNNDGIYYFNRSKVAPGKNYLVKLSFTADGTEYYKEFTML